MSIFFLILCILSERVKLIFDFLADKHNQADYFPSRELTSKISELHHALNDQPRRKGADIFGTQATFTQCRTVTCLTDIINLLGEKKLQSNPFFNIWTISSLFDPGASSILHCYFRSIEQTLYNQCSEFPYSATQVSLCLFSHFDGQFTPSSLKLCETFVHAQFLASKTNLAQSSSSILEQGTQACGLSWIHPNNSCIFGLHVVQCLNFRAAYLCICLDSGNQD